MQITMASIAQNLASLFKLEVKLPVNCLLRVTLLQVKIVLKVAESFRLIPFCVDQLCDQPNRMSENEEKYTLLRRGADSCHLVDFPVKLFHKLRQA